MQRKAAAACVVAGLLCFFTAGPSRANTRCSLNISGPGRCDPYRDAQCHEVKTALRLELCGTHSKKKALHQLQIRDPIDGQIPTPLGSSFGRTENERRISHPADVSLLQYGTPISANISSPLSGSYNCFNVEVECWQKVSPPSKSVAHGRGSNSVWGYSHVWGISHVWSNSRGWGNSSKWK